MTDSTDTATDAPAWDKHAIKAELARRGLTLVAVAEQAGIERSAPGVALLRRNFQGEAAIAAALGTVPATLWPERYAPGAADGMRAPRPRRSLGRPTPSAASPTPSTQPAQPTRPRRRGASPNRTGV